MKLILYDKLEDEIYSIQDSKYFEEQLDVEDLKEIYIEIRSFFYIQNILDDMIKNKLIKPIYEDEEFEEEFLENYRYTMHFIKNILKEKMSSIEFNGFNDYVDDYLTKRKNMI